MAKLSPKKRRELQERGLLEAQVDAFETGKPIDVSELPFADESSKTEPEDEPQPEADAEDVWAACVDSSLNCWPTVSRPRTGLPRARQWRRLHGGFDDCHRQTPQSHASLRIQTLHTLDRAARSPALAIHEVVDSAHLISNRTNQEP